MQAGRNLQCLPYSSRARPRPPGVIEVVIEVCTAKVLSYNLFFFFFFFTSSLAIDVLYSWSCRYLAVQLL
jgi:hypothetical protein